MRTPAIDSQLDAAALLSDLARSLVRRRFQASVGVEGIEPPVLSARAWSSDAHLRVEIDQGFFMWQHVDGSSVRIPVRCPQMALEAAIHTLTRL